MKNLLLYILIVQRYMFMNVNFITFVERINKLVFTMFNKLSFSNFIKFNLWLLLSYFYNICF